MEIRSHLIAPEEYTTSSRCISLPFGLSGFPIFIVASVRATAIQREASASSRPGQTLMDGLIRPEVA